MKATISKVIGKSKLTFEIEAPKVKDGLLQSTIFTTMPDRCKLCDSENVVLDGNKTDKGYTYVKVRCLDCGAASTAGEYQDGSGLFWKKFEKYVPNQTQATTSPRKGVDDDMPF